MAVGWKFEVLKTNLFVIFAGNYQLVDTPQKHSIPGFHVT